MGAADHFADSAFDLATSPTALASRGDSTALAPAHFNSALMNPNEVALIVSRFYSGTNLDDAVYLLSW